ncbi:hypothetical protein B0H12DRAFT_382329 [Mycena haematopus]|nr:hypothetical protein B0H12DRAFT_382329 [Mycena haematopus]
MWSHPGKLCRPPQSFLWTRHVPPSFEFDLPSLLSSHWTNVQISMIFLLPQPRAIKRKLDDLVSPLKKLPRTTTVADTTEAKTVIIIDSPPSSPTLHPSTSGDVSTSSAASTSTAAVTSDTQQAKIWPGGYYVYEHEAAWIKYKHLKDEYGRNKVSIHGTWDQLFPGSKFVHTTVTLWRKFWSTAPQHLKDHCVGEGRKHSGSWQHFVDTVRAHNNGRPFELPVVKTEPTSTSTHLKSIPLPDPPAMLASATEVPPEMGGKRPASMRAVCVLQRGNHCSSVSEIRSNLGAHPSIDSFGTHVTKSQLSNS